MQGKDLNSQGAVVVADGDAAGVQVLNSIPWHSIADEQQILLQLGTTFDGLSAEEAAKRLQQCVLAVPRLVWLHRYRSTYGKHIHPQVCGSQATQRSRTQSLILFRCYHRSNCLIMWRVMPIDYSLLLRSFSRRRSQTALHN